MLTTRGRRVNNFGRSGSQQAPTPRDEVYLYIFIAGRVVRVPQGWECHGVPRGGRFRKSAKSERERGRAPDPGHNALVGSSSSPAPG